MFVCVAACLCVHRSYANALFLHEASATPHYKRLCCFGFGNHTTDTALLQMRAPMLLVAISLFCPAATASGSENCPCLESLPAGAFDQYIKPGGLLYQGFEYPMTYGIGCKNWDADLQPYCADASGKALPDAPEWCQHSFCYIDPESCVLPLQFQSSYFPLSGLKYSFQTCGYLSPHSKR